VYYQATSLALTSISDDAGAPSAEIHFRTQGYVENETSCIKPSQPLPELKTTMIHGYVIRNSGQAFREEDWKRLKKIGTSLRFISLLFRSGLEVPARMPCHNLSLSLAEAASSTCCLWLFLTNV